MTDPTILQRIVDSRDREVGGGSAAALAGSMAAGLAGLVARLSEKGTYGLSPERCRGLAEEADALAAALDEGARADARAYRGVVEAYRLPHDDPQGEQARREAIQRAMVTAASVPLQNARRALRVKEVCLELEGSSNPNAASDLDVALMLARAALLGCVRNVEVNIPLIEDEATVAELSREARLLEGSQ